MTFLRKILQVCTVGWLCLGASAQAERPNIVFLLADDQRYDTMGVTGNKIVSTPQMDLLAEQGVLFDHCYVVSSACAPNRAAILSGMYSRSTGVRDFSADFTSKQRDKLYPFLLQDAGYYIGFIGKFGVAATIPATMEPYRKRFDFWRVFVGQGNYYTEERQDKHVTQVLTEDAIEFINSAPKDQPFCLSLSYKAPHGPWHEFDRRFRQEFDQTKIPYPESLTEEEVEQLPSFMRTYRLSLDGKDVSTIRRIHQKFVRNYYRLILGIDESIGRIRQALEDAGVADNTIIIYTSDNGHFLHEWGFHGKWLMYEPSIHVPLIIFDPRLPEGKRDRRVEELALSIDLAPTMLAFAGTKPPASMQGRSLVPLVEGEVPKDWRQDFFYDYVFEMYPGDIPRSIGVRNKRYKYVRYTFQRPQYEQLFDLEKDPLELKNLAQDPQYANILAQLRERTEHYRQTLPDVKPDYPEYVDEFDVVGIGSDFPSSQVDFYRARAIGQTFKAKTSKLEAVEWRWPFFIMQKPPFGVDVELRRGGPKGELLASTEIAPESIYNLNLARAVFQHDGLTPGETLYVGIKTKEAPAKRRVAGTWYYKEDNYDGGQAFFNARPQKGDLPLYFIFAKEDA